MLLPKMTVKQLIAELQKQPEDSVVRIWLPGTKIELHQVWDYREGSNETLVEGNVITGGFF